jgi:diacylglycerol kinase
MRIHIAATAYVMYFASVFYELNRAELIGLILTCVLVMSLEAVNTAIEVLTDKASPEFSALAKAAKDTAAGAVLLAAIAAVVIGVVLFWCPVTFGEIIGRLTSVPDVIGLVVSIAAACVFILTGKERRKRGKREKR